MEAYCHVAQGVVWGMMRRACHVAPTGMPRVTNGWRRSLRGGKEDSMEEEQAAKPIAIAAKIPVSMAVTSQR